MRKSKVLSFVLIAALTVSALPMQAFGTLSDEKDKLNNLQNQKQEAESKNAELEKSKTEAEAYIESVDKKLTKLSTELYKTKQKLSKTEKKIDKTQKELDDAQVSINEQYEDMKKRIKYMYENGDTQMIDLIFNSKSVTDFLNKAEYITELAKYDRDMLDKMKETKDKIASSKSTLLEEKKNLETLKAEQEQDQANLEKLAAAKQEELQGYETLIAHNEATSADIEAEIAAQESRVAAAEQASREAENNKTNSEKPKNTNENNKTTNSAGVFTWPLPGHTRISSDYGYRGSEFHKGIDIPAAQGTTIVAAASGTVEWSNYSTTAGNWMGINHGNGVYTVYMHMSSRLVSAGTKVSAGQSIGLVGNTGASFGNHLHFAVRKDGSYVNPWSYLK